MSEKAAKSEKAVKSEAGEKVKKPSVKSLVESLGGTFNGDEGRIDPSQVIIYGRDTEEQDNATLADHRAFNEPVADMAEEMAENGVRDAVKVVLTKADGKYGLALVDGRQRTINLRAANEMRQKKGLEPLQLPIRLVKLEGSALLSESVVLNEHRIADNPISRAEKAKAMLDKGMTLEAVARAFMVKKSTIVKQWLPVLGMTPSIVEAVKNGKMALNAALELVSLSHEDQETEFAKLKEAGQLNMAAAEASRRRIRGGGGEDGEKEAKPYKPLSKKYMMAFVAWSDDAGKNGAVEPYNEFHMLGIDKSGVQIPTRVVLREIFQHLLGNKVTPAIPGWKKMIQRMESPVEEKAEEKSEEAPKKKPSKKAKG